MSNEKPYIVCAAIKNPNDSGDLICGPRHTNCIDYYRIRFGNERTDMFDWEQGFVDQFGRFYSREDACRMVSITGQISSPLRARLTSEDLY